MRLSPRVSRCLSALGGKHCSACLNAFSTRVRTDRAVTMMLGVPIAFLAAGSARADAGLQQRAHDLVVPLAGPRKNPRRDVTGISAGLTERDAGSHRADVLLDEI